MRDSSAQEALSDLMAEEVRPGLRHAVRPIRTVTIEGTATEIRHEKGGPNRVVTVRRPIVKEAVSKTPVAEDTPAEDAPKAETNRVFTIRRPVVEAAPEPDDAVVDEAQAAETPPEETSPRLETAPVFAPPIVAEPDLPRWHELTKIRTGSRIGKGPTLPVVDAERDTMSVRAFDLLRTRLRQTCQERGWTNIAITSPTSASGNTFTCVNLALSMSRVGGSRTVLMDFNLRKPGVAQALEMRPRGSMRDFLLGRAPISDHMIRVSDTLALGLNNTADADAAETLQAAETAHTLERMRAALQPELVIYDMPAMLAHDDVSAFLPNLDAVLLVSDGTKTLSRELMECERLLKGQVPLLGVVLNRARKNSIKQYA